MATNNAIQQKYLGGMDQAATRDHAVWFDQHRNAAYVDPRTGERPFENGRAWWSVIEIRSGHPSGPVHPLEWEAPFDMPQSYLTDSIGRIQKTTARGLALLPVSTKTDRIRIDYARMLRDDEQAALEHWRLCVANATRYQLPIPEHPGVELDYRLIELAGPEPRSPLIAKALMAGDPWILGQQAPTFNPKTQSWEVEENEQLAKLLRRTVRGGLMPQDIRPEPVTPPNEVRELKEQLVELQRQFARLAPQADPPKRGPGRPPKVTTISQASPKGDG